MVDLSIIIASFNTKEFTENSIKSVLKSNRKISTELIVVDNGSNDGSLEALQEFKNKNLIKLLSNRDNLGFSKANNQGIEFSNGRHVLLLNSDTIIKNGSLDKLVEFADQHEDAGVVGPRLILGSGEVQKSCGYFPTVSGVFNAFWKGKKDSYGVYAPRDMLPVKVDYVVGAAFLMTQKAREFLPKLNEKYFFYYEDIDYCRAIKRIGLNVYYLPSAEIVHFTGESGKNLTDQANQWRRFIPSSKIYHGLIKHYIIFLIMWSRQKWEKFFTTKK